MAKSLLLVCAAEPGPPSRYASALGTSKLAWSGAAWEGGSLGQIQARVVPASPRLRKAVPWPIAAAVQFTGAARPKREWTALDHLAVAVLEDTAGALTSTTGRPRCARLTAALRDQHRRAVMAAVNGPTQQLVTALTAATEWLDEPFCDALAAELIAAADRGADEAAFESLAEIVATARLGSGLAEGVRSLCARLGDQFDRASPLVAAFAACDRAGRALGARARTMLGAARQIAWTEEARAEPPSRSASVDAIVAGAHDGDARACAYLEEWAGLARSGAGERAALWPALVRCSVARGPWSPTMRELVSGLIRAVPDPAALAADTANAADAAWMAETAAAVQAERDRVAAISRGIAERNAVRLRTMRPLP